MSFYDNSELVNINKIILSDNDRNYLNLFGTNFYPLPFRVIAGRPSQPSLACQTSERDGIYFPQEGVVGFTDINGKTMHVSRSMLTIFDTYGKKYEISFTRVNADVAITFPEEDGRLALTSDIYSEQLIGTKDGVNTTFTTTYNYKYVLDVIHEGVADRNFTQTPGTNSITYTDTPIPDTGERLKVIYVKA